jgi:3-methyladenine DNA glycosylase AlkD
MTADIILQELQALANPEIAAILQAYFKTGKGQYAENDVFMGIKVPSIRYIVKRYNALSLTEIQNLLQSKYHEARMAGLLVLTGQFVSTKTEENRKEIFNFYLQNTSKINNWDLVDASCRFIIGGYLLDKKDRSILYKLADSEYLWEERMAIVSTWTFIKNDEYDDTLNLARKLAPHKHDLIHKAVGWMLREVGKKDKAVLLDFLDQNRRILPRTALRYAIEIFSPEEKKQYLK